MVNGQDARDYGGLMGQAMQTFLDEPPFSETLTSYDREHMKLYMRRHGDAQRASPIDMRMTSAPQPKQES